MTKPKVDMDAVLARMRANLERAQRLAVECKALADRLRAKKRKR